MQPQIGWDQIAIDYRPPWETRLFWVYVFLVLTISIVKSLNILGQLWFSSINNRITRRKPSTGNKQADILAASALASRIATVTFAEQSSGRPHFLLLEQADSRYVYLWDRCCAQVDSLRRLVVLTLLLAILASVSVTINNLAEFSNQKVSSLALISGSFAAALLPFEVGFSLCAVLWLICGFFEGTLKRRRASWTYVMAKARFTSTANSASTIAGGGKVSKD